jgi:ribose transport system permease protein
MSIATWESVTRTAARLRYRFSLKLFLSELLQKPWMEPGIPFLAMVAMLAYFSLTIHNYASWDNTQSLMRLFGEFGFVALAMGITLISGGIDLSVGSTFALANFTALALFELVELPMPLVVIGTLGVGALVGAINGVLIGYLKARPFLTTLVTLIIVRASVNLLSNAYSVAFATSSVESDSWDALGGGFVLGVPTNAAALVVVLLAGHIVLSRSRPGWHVSAIGSSRKAARHAGIRVELMLFSTYVLSGVLCAAGGLFYAARQNSADSQTGQGWELQALTAVVLGGISLGGGKGTVWRAMIGAIIIFALANGFLRMGIEGYITSSVIGLILLTAVGVDVKWAKNRAKTIQKIYVNPGLVELTPPPSIERTGNSPFAQNDRLLGVEAIGLDQVEGPEDVIRPPGPALRQHAGRQHHPLLRPQFRAARGLRAYRRPALRHAVRQGREPHRLRRRHGRLRRQALGRGVQGHRRDQPHLVQAQRRQPRAHGRRSRHRARRQDLFQRLHHALRGHHLCARRDGGAAQRPRHLSRPRHRQDPHRHQAVPFPERHLRRP